MVQITYRIVEHDGGWAYRLGDTFSETYPDHDSARDRGRGLSRALRSQSARRQCGMVPAFEVGRPST